MKKELKKKLEKELNDIYDFMSAEENQDYAFTMAEAEKRAKEIEKKLTSNL
jgi:transcription elongation GreA/GreB family factor